MVLVGYPAGMPFHSAVLNYPPRMLRHSSHPPEGVPFGQHRLVSCQSDDITVVNWWYFVCKLLPLYLQTLRHYTNPILFFLFICRGHVQMCLMCFGSSGWMSVSNVSGMQKAVVAAATSPHFYSLTPLVSEETFFRTRSMSVIEPKLWEDNRLIKPQLENTVWRLNNFWFIFRPPHSSS